MGALALAVMALTDRMTRARALAIDQTELGVLRVTADGGAMRPTDIAAELSVHPSSVTRHVQALELAGKVAVGPDPTDGRASLITVTAAGLADLWQVHDQGVGAFQEVLAGWQPEEVRALTASLSRLIAALDAQAKHHADQERRPGQ